MKKKYYGFHGDLDLFKLDELPKRAKPLTKNKEFVCQQGSATGHSHKLTSDEEFEVFTIKEKGIEHFIYVLSKEAELSHEEHRTHVLEAGIYYQDQETEESPQDGIVRAVID